MGICVRAIRQIHHQPIDHCIYVLHRAGIAHCMKNHKLFLYTYSFVPGESGRFQNRTFTAGMQSPQEKEGTERER
jgi:hypothetical protein